MGLFTQLGQMKDLITAAPALIDSANRLAASARTPVAVDHINLSLYGEPDPAMLEPIAGVDLAAYARVSKGIAAFGYDTSRLPEVALGLGIAAADWESASLGWGARIQADRAVGSRFNQLYTAL